MPPSTFDCPECGREIEATISHVEKEIKRHWGIEVKDVESFKNPQARERMEEMITKATGSKGGKKGD